MHNTQNNIPLIIDIPQIELDKFDRLIREYREKYIRSSEKIVDLVFISDNKYKEMILSKNVSSCINELREAVWNSYLEDEVAFNTTLMKDLYGLLETPKEILNKLLEKVNTNMTQDELHCFVREVCGEYAGRVYPYIYRLSLSNTQSRRSRAGKTFESIIYKIYDILKYPYDSQGKIGRKIFDDAGLGKKVDSILPSVEHFKQRRNKTIVGTMKTSLRERWQEVAEEIERTKIPEIHLLTADEDISINKLSEMSNHNIIVVSYQWVAESENYKSLKNIISFEDYLFSEIPSIIKFWNQN